MGAPTEQGHAPMSWIDAMAFMRLEEIREDIRRELDEAARWTVTANPCWGMSVQVGPHRVPVLAAMPVRGRIDLVCAGLQDGFVRPYIAAGVPNHSPIPPVLNQAWGYPLAWINVQAATCTIGPWNISPVPPLP